MIIPYKTFGDGSRLPFSRLQIQGAKNSLILEAFVDSGADFTICHAACLADLGLSTKRGILKRILVGDGDEIHARLFLLSVSFYGYSFKAPICFSERLGPGFNLLGRKGFFDRFRFCFDDKHARLSISRL